MTWRRILAQEILPRALPAHHGKMPVPVERVRIVGLFGSASGLGQSARLAAAQLQESGWPVETHDVSRWLANRGRDTSACKYGREEPSKPGAGEITLAVLNPPMLHAGAVLSGIRRFYRSYVVGFWAWELETLPASWARALQHVDAVFVPSRFSKRAFEKVTGKPVHVVAHGIDAPTVRAEPPDDRFRVLSIFNFGSSAVRKNPACLVQAFRMAFGDDPRTELLLKSADGAQYPKQAAQLRALIGGFPNVRYIDGVLNGAELGALFQSASVYASLHRSEGFGLTLAEAIMAEVPVVTTNWSGSADFCDPDLCYPVDYALIPFSDSHPDYRGIAAARWAEPSAASAAAQLLAVRRDGDAARDKARALKASLQRHLEAHTLPLALSKLGASPAGGAA